ncbi:MAG: MFS transporter [Bacteroidetes bacterium]|nr:MFS transporter [Bacteroidota bacterium]
MPDAQIKNDPMASVRIPEFKFLMLGRYTFVMSLRMMSTVLGWWIYLLTRDPFAIGLLGLSEVIPAISLALYAGHFIDLHEKKRLILRGLILYTTCAILLFLFSTSFTSSHLSNHGIALCIYFIIFCTGIIRAFVGPVFNVLLAYIVPKNYLQNATTWSQGTWLGASVSGHATGGFLIALIGISGTLLTIICLMTLSFIFLTKLKRKPPTENPGEKRTWESVKEGLRFVYKTKELLGAITLDMFAVFFGGAAAMIPVYAKDILNIGAEGFGWLNASTDLGSICSVILLTIAPMQAKQGKKLFFAVAGFGICVMVFAFSKSFWLSFGALVISGMLDGISVVVRGTIMQLKTPDNMRGRVLSVNSMFINSSNELGQFESGIAAKLFGVVPSVFFGGCLTLIVVVTTWFKAPALRKMEY